MPYLPRRGSSWPGGTSMSAGWQWQQGSQQWPWEWEEQYREEHPKYGLGFSGLRPLTTEELQSAWTGAQKEEFRGLSYQRAIEALERDEPRFGTLSTLTEQQQQILSQLISRQGAPTISPITVSPVGGLPTAQRPTYGAVPLAGAGARRETLGRMMGVSPGEEAAAIEAMSAPAMRQFREEILPGIRGTAVGTRTAWSRSRAREEARAGAGLSEELAGMGEQYRLQRRGQAMQAVGLGAGEAQAAAGLGMQQYGMEMQPFMQAQQLGAQAGMQTQMAQLQAALQGQQLGAQMGMGREQMLAQLLGQPMMAYYSY